MTRFTVWLLLVSTAACGELPSTDFDARADRHQQPMIGGRPTDADAFPETGALLFGEAMCSATLIAPDVVLTAAHCVVLPKASETPVAYAFERSKDVSKPMPGLRHAVRENLVHPQYQNFGAISEEAEAQATAAMIASCGEPSLFYMRTWMQCVNALPVELRIAMGMYAGLDADHYDLALLFLQTPVHGVLPASVSHSADDLALSASTGWVDLVGYGESRGGLNHRSFGRSHHLQAHIDALGASKIRIGEHAPQACFGDSGGPAFVTTDGVRRIVGVTSHLYAASIFGVQAGNCNSGAVYQRVDSEAAWIDAAMFAACARGVRDARSCLSWPTSRR